MSNFGLNKNMVSEKSELAKRLREAHEKVSDAVSKYNDVMAAEFASVESAVSEFNAIVGEANEFQQTVSGDTQSEFDEKTEKWQEGDSGQSVSEFISLWEEELEELVIDQPDEMEAPGTDAIDAFEEKPTKPE